MAINFIPNDPDAGAAAPGMRRKDPSPNRPSSSSGFTFSNQSAEGEADPGTPQFLFWQAREAAIASGRGVGSVCRPDTHGLAGQSEEAAPAARCR